MKLQQWPLSCNNPRVWSQVAKLVSSSQKRYSSSQCHRYHPLKVLHDARIANFRETCFVPEVPVILPHPHFRNLPAFERWFEPTSDRNVSRLNTEYLEQHGPDALVPLELTQIPPDSSEGNGNGFRQLTAPLGLFLQWIREAEKQEQSLRLYLAQCQLLDLPNILRDDFPSPELVTRAGKGDVYDTNVWIGHPPTYTPLHRDPNPNLFVQLAGRKVVRLLPPGDGLALFASVRRRIGKSADRGAAVFRGEEMMQGEERELLEQAVWGSSDANNASGEGYEAHLEAGDGLFIPNGWWHSIKGVGEGVTASVRF